jgi:LysM repeat protein
VLAAGVLVLGAAAQQYKTVTVQRGDSLWKLAQQHLGSGDKWRQFLSVNNLPNPNRISPGQVLNIPGTQVAEAPKPPEPPQPEPQQIEVPVSALETMLKDAAARLEPVAKDLAAIRERLGAVENRLGAVGEKIATPPTVALDTSSLERRVQQLNASLDKVSAQVSALAPATAASGEVGAQLKSLRGELEALTKSVEEHTELQRAAMAELGAKVAAKPAVAMAAEDEEEDAAPKKKRLAGLLSALAVGIAFLTVSATR